MAEKTIPVYSTRGSEKVQIGVAGEVDPKTNAQAIDIWDKFKDQKISNLTIGNPNPPLRAEEPAPKTREEFRSSNKQEDKS